mgnify:CR=1 FL=1
MNSRCTLSMRPAGTSTFCLRSAFSTSCGREVVGGEALGIEPDAHRIFALAEHGHGGDPAQRLQLILDVAVGVVGDLERRVPVAGEGDVEDRLGVGLDLLDHRLVDLVGEMSPHPRGAVAHIGGGIIGIALELESGW